MVLARLILYNGLNIFQIMNFIHSLIEFYYIQKDNINNYYQIS